MLLEKKPLWVWEHWKRQSVFTIPRKMKVTVRSAHAKYLKRIEESKKQDEIRKQRENKRRCLRRGGQLKKKKKLWMKQRRRQSIILMLPMKYGCWNHQTCKFTFFKCRLSAKGQSSSSLPEKEAIYISFLLLLCELLTVHVYFKKS